MQLLIITWLLHVTTAAQACVLRRYTVVFNSIYYSIYSICIVKICDKMYYFLIKITYRIDSLYFSFTDFITIPEGRCLILCIK